MTNEYGEPVPRFAIGSVVAVQSVAAGPINLVGTIVDMRTYQDLTGITRFHYSIKFSIVTLEFRENQLELVL